MKVNPLNYNLNTSGGLSRPTPPHFRGAAGQAANTAANNTKKTGKFRTFKNYAAKKYASVKNSYTKVKNSFTNYIKTHGAAGKIKVALLAAGAGVIGFFAAKGIKDTVQEHKNKD